MVGNDEFQAQLARGLGLVHTRNSAVHGDHDVGTPRRQFAQRLVIQAVAFLDPMRYVVVDLTTK